MGHGAEETNNFVEKRMTETDDFANDKEIQRARKEKAEFDKMVKDSIAIVKNRFQMKKTSRNRFKEFWMIKSLTIKGVFETVKSDNPFYPLVVSIIEYHSHYPTARGYNAGDDYYFFGLLTTRKSYPATLIYPEKFSDKIADVFTRAELDLKENKKFSRNFYALTKEKDALRQAFSFLSLDELSEFKNLEFELRENYCLFRSSRKPVSLNEAQRFCAAAEKLIRIFG